MSTTTSCRPVIATVRALLVVEVESLEQLATFVKESSNSPRSEAIFVTGSVGGTPRYFVPLTDGQPPESVIIRSAQQLSVVWRLLESSRSIAVYMRPPRIFTMGSMPSDEIALNGYLTGERCLHLGGLLQAEGTA